MRIGRILLSLVLHDHLVNSWVSLYPHRISKSSSLAQIRLAIPLWSLPNEDEAVEAPVTSVDVIPDDPIDPKDTSLVRNRDKVTWRKGEFDLSTALFCGGLAFDAYVEPPSNSSRWEKGSRGMQVAFVSLAFTRSIYKGLLEVTPLRCTGLPEDESAAERFLTGAGVDAAILVAALEGSWQEDVDLLEKEQHHEGVLDLTGAAHVGRTATAWANVDERQSEVAKKQRGRASPYHIKGGWGKGGQAVWPEAEPFYLYLQDPATVRLVFTVLDADRVGEGKPIGSTYKRLSDLIPQARLAPEKAVEEMKRELLQEVAKGNIDLLNETAKIQLGAKAWTGRLKLTSKPRKRDKNSQILAGAAAGAYLAGPVGAAAGALLGSFYEGEVQGTIEMRLQYLPIPQVPVPRKVHRVVSGIPDMPDINWGKLNEKHKARVGLDTSPLDDLEHCFFINHEDTGATCAVYRSLNEKLIVVSFRGTCAPIDLITDASLVQDAWVAGEDVKDQAIPKVHAGFRRSLDSISRRLKELILACPAPGENFADYALLVTGHSLGGALATLFTADIAAYGVDAGRGLPQQEESEPWWKSLANTLTGQTSETENDTAGPPRPRSLRVYSFGSPRVGNKAFAELFDALTGEGWIDQAYRVVNGEDVVARLPRTMNGLVFGVVNYEHCGPTVLCTHPETAETPETPIVWVEGESDNRSCPVRDGVALVGPNAEGSLLAELFAPAEEAELEQAQDNWSKLSSAVTRLTKRVPTLTASDLGSILGIDRSFTDREVKLVQSLLRGRALAHHMEDEYYSVLRVAADEH